MINEELKATGELHIVLRDKNGNLKTAIVVPNLVVTIGKNFIASRMTGANFPVMSHMAVGTSAVVPVAANVTLGAELSNSRSGMSVVGGVAVANVVTFTATFLAGVGTGGIVEAGIFNAITGGTMLCRTAFPIVNKDVEDSLTISWAVTIT